jgi:GR25 family glycosyltransferase involved in LPS biosynthesis
MEYNTYIINLKRDHIKYKNISNRLNSIGIEYDRFDAIDGRDINSKYDDYISHYKPFIPRAIIGCGLSHFIACKEHFDKDKTKIALILEDDAVPLFKSKKYINEIIDKAPNDWEIILLYTQGKTNYKDKTWDSNKYMGSTMAYLINYKGYKKRYDNYKLVTHTDIERNFTNCIIYKNPDMCFIPDLCASSTSSNIKSFDIVYQLLDEFYSHELESDITGFTGSMVSRYKIVRIPYLEIELDQLELFIFISIILSIIALFTSKNKLNTITYCIRNSLIFFVLYILLIKLYINIIN